MTIVVVVSFVDPQHFIRSTLQAELKKAESFQLSGVTPHSDEQALVGR